MFSINGIFIRIILKKTDIAWSAQTVCWRRLQDGVIPGPGSAVVVASSFSTNIARGGGRAACLIERRQRRRRRRQVKVSPPPLSFPFHSRQLPGWSRVASRVLGVAGGRPVFSSVLPGILVLGFFIAEGCRLRPMVVQTKGEQVACLGGVVWVGGLVEICHSPAWRSSQLAGGSADARRACISTAVGLARVEFPFSRRD